MTQHARLRFTGRAQWDGEGRRAAARGVRLAAEHVLAESRDEVPIEEATLERSGTASVDERQLTAAVSYDTPYAVRQHEQMDYRHDPGRKAKYLEDPMNRSREVVAQILAAELRRWAQ